MCREKPLRMNEFVLPTATTKLVAVIGDPVRHSLSPVMFNAAFRALDMDWLYVALPVKLGSSRAAIDGIRALDIAGLSVTTPHKETVAAAVDELSPVAMKLGAVNCVRRDGEALIGENTDGKGFVESVRSGLDIAPESSNVVVVGAGGAARAVTLALAEAGATVTVVNRTKDKAEKIVNQMAMKNISTSGFESIIDADLVVQATPQGMRNDDPLPFDSNLIGQGQTLVDLIYHPERTPIATAAAANGAQIANGVGMLLYQAGEQFRIWTGEEPPLQIMAAAVGLNLSQNVGD